MDKIAFYSNTKGFSGSKVYLRDLMLAAVRQIPKGIVFFCNNDHPLLENSGLKPFFKDGSIKSVFINPYLFKQRPSEETCENKIFIRIQENFFKRAYRSWIPGNFKLLIGTIREIVRLRKMFQEHPVDLLHFNDTGCEPAVIAARLAGLKCIIGTFHVSPSCEKETSAWVHKLIEYFSVRSLHGGISVAQTVKEQWMERVGADGRFIDVIYNGIDAKKLDQAIREASTMADWPFERKSAESVVICTPARLHFSKGQNHLISVIPDLLAQFPQTLFVFVGEGPQRAEYESMVKQLNLSSSVFFMGFRKDVHSVMAYADIIVLPSTGLEALPYVIVEAMAMGKPVVSTRVGGIPEMITHEKSGYVLEPADSQALKKALVLLITSRDMRLSMGAEGKEMSARFSITEMIKNTQKFYQKMLKTNMEFFEYDE